MNSLVFYLAPPVIGAIIGYVTNAIAIKMLFRPLYPVKIGRFQVPFTPGILPRERHKLADNIGRMVEKELLTEEIIRRRLAQDDVVEAVKQGVATATQQLLDTEFQQDSTLARETIHFIVQIIHNPRFINSIESILDKLLEQLQHRTISDLSGKELEELKSLIQEMLLQKLEQVLPSASQSLAALLDSYYEELKDRIITFLRKPEIHKQLETQGRIFLQKTLQKLNTFQRFFISAAQYDKTLDERMGDIIDDLIVQIDTLLSKPENRTALNEYVKHIITDLVEKRETLYSLSGMLYGFIAPLLHKESGALIQSITGMEWEAQRQLMLQRLSDWLLNLREESIQTSIANFFNKQGSNRIGDLVVLDGAEKSQIDTRIAQTLINLANSKIADALKTINIRSIVSDRIDSLDMEDVERIVLDVMANQFKWINVFGGILGALIGAGQVLLSIYLKTF